MEFLVIAFILFSVGGFIILVWFLRWLLGIYKILDSLDKMVSLLERLSKNQRCQACDGLYVMDELKKIKSGQLLCSSCIEAIEEKSNLKPAVKKHDYKHLSPVSY